MPRVITEESRAEGYARMWNWLQDHKDVSTIKDENDLTQLLLTEFQSPTHAYDLAVALVEGPAKDTISDNISRVITPIPAPLGVSPKGIKGRPKKLIRFVRIKRRDGRIQRYHIKTENLKKRYVHRGRGLYSHK